MSNKRVPLYKQIEEDILKKINSGYYQENTIIPKEIDLAELYKVSRPTVRQAIQELVNQGYLERRKRKGTIVKTRKIKQEFTKIIESYDDEMNRKGIVPKTKVLGFKKDVANEEISQKLQLNIGDDVYKLIRLRYASESPIVLVTTYIPVYLLPDFLENDFTQVSLYSILQESDKGITSVTRRLEIIKTDETTSDLLDIPKNDPIFYFHTIGYTGKRIPIEYSISKYRWDLNCFVFEISNEDSLRLTLNESLISDKTDID
ncbi:GntR family transcriptional regulator [Amphibacillus sp. Q70]|uniref:GntR family transcriptional regulator n=1 Tax=Amphibacillus sp. Q70 TaxID=3453416 RepID=UPI003F85FA15